MHSHQNKPLYTGVLEKKKKKKFTIVGSVTHSLWFDRYLLPNREGLKKKANHPHFVDKGEGGGGGEKNM